MVLNDLADNGKAKPGTLVTFRHIGLQQSGPVNIREAGAVIRHTQHHEPVPEGQRQAHAWRGNLMFGQTVQRVLDDVGQRLTQQSRIADHPVIVVPRPKINLEIHPLAVIESNLTKHQIAKRQRLHDRLRHAGKVRKLVDHAADIIHLPANDGEIFGELFTRLFVLRLVFAAQPVCRKLDRGQRVLDFMRDPPRHIRPGGLALGCQKIRHIVKGDNIADDPPVDLLRRDSRPQRHPRAIPRQDDLFLGKLAAPRRSRRDQAGKFRHHIFQPVSDQFGIFSLQKLPRRKIRQRYLMRGIKTDHTRRHAAQHRLSEFATPVDLHIGLDKLFAASRQFIQHVVERQAKPRNFIDFEPGRHAF